VIHATITVSSGFYFTERVRRSSSRVIVWVVVDALGSST
jgi:hypothetical protein